MNRFLEWLNIRESSDPTVDSVSGEGVKAMQRALNALSSKMGEDDRKKLAELARSGHISSPSVPVMAAMKMLNMLRPYRDPHVPNYDQIASMVRSDMSSAAKKAPEPSRAAPPPEPARFSSPPPEPESTKSSEVKTSSSKPVDIEILSKERNRWGNKILIRLNRKSKQIYFKLKDMGLVPKGIIYAGDQNHLLNIDDRRLFDSIVSVVKSFELDASPLEDFIRTGVIPSRSSSSERSSSEDDSGRDRTGVVKFKDGPGNSVFVKTSVYHLPREIKDFVKESIQYTFPEYKYTAKSHDGSRDEWSSWFYTIAGNFKQYVTFGQLLGKFGYPVDELRKIIKAKLDTGRLSRTDWEGRFDKDKEFQDSIEKKLPDSMVDLYDEQKFGVAFLYGRDHAILGDETGFGKCILPDSWIQTNKGILDIEQIWNSFAENPIINEKGEEWAKLSSDLYVHSMDSNEKIVKSKVVGIYREKINSVVKEVKTSNGKSIKATIPHKFYTDSGWENEIVPGDLICSSPNHQDLYYERVVEVKRVEYDGYVYDLCVENNHNYIANGLICHNTIQLLTAAALRMQANNKPTLIITLKATQKQFAGEILRVMGEGEKDKISLDPANPKKWTVIRYSDFSGGVGERNKKVEQFINKLKGAGFGIAILDELHKVKHGKSQRSKNIASVVETIPTKWGASATVSSNKPIDVKNQLLMMGHQLGRIDERKFKRDFAGVTKGTRKKGSGNDEAEIRAAERLNKWLNLSGVYVRREKGDIREMPELSVGSDSTGIDQAKFNDIYSEKIREYSSRRSGGDVLPVNKLMAARLAVAQLKTDETTQKVLSIVADGEGKPPAASKVVVFTNFKESGKQLVSKISEGLKRINPAYKVITYLSDTAKLEREQVKSVFTDDPNAKVLIMSMKMGGTGIDFPNASQHMVINDFDWTPESAEQSEGRIYRINTNHPVNIRYVVGNGLDQELFERVQRKREIAAIIQKYRREYHDAEAAPEALRKIIDAQKEIKKINDEMVKIVATELPGAEEAMKSESFSSYLNRLESFSEAIIPTE